MLPLPGLLFPPSPEESSEPSCLPRRPTRGGRAGLRFGWSLLPLLGLLFLGGCGGSLPPLAPVKGAVTIDGTAVTSGNVALVPLEAGKGEKAPPSSGQIDSSGNYEIFTGGKAGAPLGKYKVVVTPAMMPMEGMKPGRPKLPFNQKYGDMRDTPLRIEVVSSPAAGAYDLKLTR